MASQNDILKHESWTNYLPTLAVVLFSCATVLVVDFVLFQKVINVNYSNFVLELLLSTFAFVALFSIQKYKATSFYWYLNIGLYLLFISFFVDALDQYFSHSIAYTVVYEKITLISAVILLFFGGKKWMNDFEKISLTDDLTKIPNRKLSREIVSREISLCAKQNTPLCLVILDIDFFKKINDQYGHNIGDKVLKNFAELLSGLVRSQDNVGRWGGEEFLILLKGVDIKRAVNTMNRLRSRISEHEFVQELKQLNLTVSIGVSQMKEDDDFESLFIKADKQLYEAKKAGRNIVKP